MKNADNTQVIEVFNNKFDWKLEGVTAKGEGDKLEYLVSGSGSMSKQFEYDIQQYHYLNIEIAYITGDITWDITVLTELGKFTLQTPSTNYNMHNDAFTYPLKGYMIQHVGGVPSSYQLKINFNGFGIIGLKQISITQPDYEKKYNFIQNQGVVGNVNMAGNPTLDIDCLKNQVELENQLQGEHHFVVYPYSRLALYPSHNVEEVSTDLNLKVSAFFGVEKLGEYKAAPVLENFSKVTVDSKVATVINSSWYPHKLELNCEYEQGNLIVTDYFVSEETIARHIENNTGTKVSIEISDVDNGSWKKVEDYFIFESYSRLNKYYYVMTFNQEYEIITTKSGYQLTFDHNAIDMALTFTEVEDINIQQVEYPIAINRTKEYWQELLRLAPTPNDFGIETKLGVISEQKHKLMYYSAWTYMLGDMLRPTFETGYGYGQQLLGKASMQTEGAPISSGNNSWESILQLQLLALINPDFAEDNMDGVLKMVDSNGKLDGEGLPTRFAQTVWIIYNQTHNITFLEHTYGSLKRFLEYKSINLHWSWRDIDEEDEVGSEFVISWLFDSGYMIKIANELKYTEEVSYWKDIQDSLRQKYYDYFFVDPTSLEAVGAYPSGTNGVRADNHPIDKSSRGIWQRIYLNHFNSDGSNKHNGVRGDLPENAHVIMAGLVINDLEEQYTKRLLSLFTDVYDPNLALSGFTNSKYGSTSVMMYGLEKTNLNEEEMEIAKNDLYKASQVWTFCELFEYNTNNPLGTLPTSFSTNTIIENTLLLNGMSYHDGEVKYPIKKN